MNALPSFEPPQQSPQRRRSRRLRPQIGPISGTTGTSTVSPSPVTIDPIYAHRRRGLEAIAKLLTYSSLSVFGTITLVNSICYNLTQSNKLQFLEAELQNTKNRTDKLDRDFIRDFDPRLEKSIAQDNTYKVAPDRLQILFVNPESPPAAVTSESQN